MDGLTRAHSFIRFVPRVCAVGSGQTVQTGTSLLRRGGSLIVVGLYGGSMPLSTAMLPFRAWRLQGSYVGTPQEMKELAELASQGKLEEIPIQKRKLEDAQAVLDELVVGWAGRAWKLAWLRTCLADVPTHRLERLSDALCSSQTTDSMFSSTYSKCSSGSTFTGPTWRPRSALRAKDVGRGIRISA